MSDILTSAALSMLGEQQDQDNLIRFLTKLTQFSLDQCSQFTRLIGDEQQTGDLGSVSTGHSGILQEQQVIKQLLFILLAAMLSSLQTKIEPIRSAADRRETITK